MQDSKEKAMAYTCIYAHSRECDGCGECEKKEQYDPRWDCEYDNDEEYCRECER